MPNPSLNPSTYRRGRKKDDAEPYIDWREAAETMKPAEAGELESMLRRYIDAKALQREAEEVLGTYYKPKLSKELYDKLVESGLTRLSYASMRFAIQSTSRSTISAEMLLAHGVSPDVIRQCTQTTESSFVVMRSERE